MAISLKCVCGAVLQIDDAFVGRPVPCPDCNRVLDTTPPLPPPKTTSGWAVAGLVASLAGMLTLVGPMIGVLCGFLGYRQIQRDPKVGGIQFAKAAMVLGGVFTLLSVFVLLGSDLLGVDGYLRIFARAKTLKYANSLTLKSRELTDFRVALKFADRAWGELETRGTDEDLTLVNLWEDAHLTVFGILADPDEDLRMKAIQRFLDSEVVKRLAPNPPPFPAEAQIQTIGEPQPKSQWFKVELPMGDTARVFLFRLFEGRSRINVVVAGTRRTRFGRLEEAFAKILESCELVKSAE